MFLLISGNKEKELSLLNVSQSSRVELFGLARDETEAYNLYKSYIYLVWDLIKETGLPIR